MGGVLLTESSPHKGTWPKTLLHNLTWLGVANTEGGGLARRLSSEIGRLAAKRAWYLKSSQVDNPRSAFCIEQRASSKAKKKIQGVVLET
jgi:hypothetical protein